MNEIPHIYILSRGRVGNQKSLQPFLLYPKLLDFVTLVTPESEVKDHLKQDYGKKIEVVGAPEGLHLERKRYGVVRNHLSAGRSEYLMMLDDDLTFQVWSGSSFVSAKKYPEIWGKVISTEIPAVLRKNKPSGMTFPIPFFAKDYIKKKGMYKPDTLVCAVNYWRAEDALQVFETEPMANTWAEDNWMTLAFLTSGRKTGMSYWATRGTDFKTEGGAGTYRSDLDVQVSFLRLMKRFPGLVSRRVVKDPATQHAHAHLQVDFKSAVNYSSLKSRLSVLGEKLFSDELKRAQLTEKEFLRLEKSQREKGPLAKQPAMSYLNMTKK